MALKRGQRVNGGGFLDLKELADDGPVICIFRVVEFCEDEPGDFGRLVPVVADVLICSGRHEGEVHLGEKFIGGITAPLRGVPNPNKAKGIGVLPPENKVGDEVVLRVKVTNKGKGNAGAVGDEPSDAEYDTAERVHADGKGWDNVPASAPAEREPASAGAGGGKSRPW